jgi:hypothetical protein
MSDAPTANADFVDLLTSFIEHEVEFLIVGAFAMAAHDVPRATGDLDVLVRPSAANADRVRAALTAFGAPLDSHGMTTSDLATEGTVYQLGLPPRRIDVLTSLSGVTFDEAQHDAVDGRVGTCPVRFIGLEALIRNKHATGRTKDLADVERLEARRG